MISQPEISGTPPGTRAFDRSIRIDPGPPARRDTDVLAQFSHELRNAFATIRAAMRILDSGGDPAKNRARELVDRQLAQMTRLVDDLLDISRMRHGRMRLRLARRDLRNVLVNAMQAVDHAMRQKNHRTRLSLPDLPVMIDCDEQRMEQVLVNLLVNAAKYTPEGGEISLDLVHQDTEALVSVRDSGIGMAPELLPKVFDLYVQADASSRRDGLGLGLPLVRSLVEAHGGRVHASSRGIGMGSEFMVRLPTSR